MSSRNALRTVFFVVVAWTASVGAAETLAQAAYESPFEGYRSHRQPLEPLEWREANRRAGELGGFVGQMRAAPRPPATAQRPGASAPLPMRGFGEMVSPLRAGDRK